MNPMQAEGTLVSNWKPEDIDGLRVVLHFTNPIGQEGRPQNPAVLFEVTLRAENIAPAGRLIKFESNKGDEYHGWVRMDWLAIEEVLGMVAEDGKTVNVLERNNQKIAA